MMDWLLILFFPILGVIILLLNYLLGDLDYKENKDA